MDLGTPQKGLPAKNVQGCHRNDQSGGRGETAIEGTRGEESQRVTNGGVDREIQKNTEKKRKNIVFRVARSRAPLAGRANLTYDRARILREKIPGGER